MLTGRALCCQAGRHHGPCFAGHTYLPACLPARPPACRSHAAHLCYLPPGSPASHPSCRQFTAHRNVSGRGIEFHFVDSAGEEHDFSAKKCME